RVQFLVDAPVAEKRVSEILKGAGAAMDRVSFHVWPTDRSWTRDSGPIFIRNKEGKVGIANWKFNAWAKYDDWHLDDQVPGRVAHLLGLPQWQPTIEIAGQQTRL